MMRGSRVELMLLNNVDEKLVEAQQMGFVWLKVLKVSARNWAVKCSLNFMFLNSARSVFQKPGARIAPGRSFGRFVWVAVGTLKAEALNQAVIVCGALAFGSPT